MSTQERTAPIGTGAGLIGIPDWGWRLAPLVLVLAVYAPLVPGLVREWTEFPTLSHGFAIPFIAAYLVWIRRDRILGAAWSTSLWGLPVLILGLVGLVLGVQGEEPFLARVSLPVALLGLVQLLGGWAVTRQAWMGVAYLLFMVPLPYSTLKLITSESRVLDATVAAAGLVWLGVPVFADGVLLHLPNMTLEVADECSSIPAIAALLSLGVVYACLGTRPWGFRVALILATVPMAISANIIRIMLTAAGVYYLGPWTLGSFFHQFSGTVTFLLTFLFLMFVDQAMATAARWIRR